MRRFLLTGILSTLFAVLGGASASAALVQLGSPGAFNSTTQVLQTFETPTINIVPLTFDATAFRATATSWAGGVTPSGTMGLVENLPDEPMRVTFSVDVFEVGMFFGNDDFGLTFNAIVEAFAAGNVSQGSVQVAANRNDFADQFIGLRSDVALRSVEIRYQRPNAQGLSVYIDDFRVGLNNTSQVVPEPTSMVLLGIGALGMAGYTWRRRRTMKTA